MQGQNNCFLNKLESINFQYSCLYIKLSNMDIFNTWSIKLLQCYILICWQNIYMDYGPMTILNWYLYSEYSYGHKICQSILLKFMDNIYNLFDWPVSTCNDIKMKI